MAKKTTPAKKTVKKSAPKTSVKTRTSVQSLKVAKAEAPKTSVTKTSASKTSLSKTLKTRKSYIILVIFMLALGALLYYGRGIFVAAVVNGQPISRLAVVKETEKQSGKQVLETIIRNTLIEQEARKAKVSVSDKELDEELKKIEQTVTKQGQKLDDVLATQGMSRNDLKKLIRLQKLVDKIVGQEVKVSQQEVDEYIEKNRDLLPQEQTEEQWRKLAEEQIKNSKLTEKVQAWLESIHNKAKVLYFVQY